MSLFSNKPIGYILRNGKPDPTWDIAEHMRFMEDIQARTIAKTKIGDVEVSTVFLGIDHAFGGGTPILYETMIFGGEHGGELWRYTSQTEAEQGHERAIAIVKGMQSNG